MQKRFQHRAIVGLAAVALLSALLPRESRGQAVLTADEFRLLPLRMHLLRAKVSKDLNCQLQVADARRILKKVNGIWKQAGIQFYAESILSEEAGSQDLYEGFGANRTEGHLKVIRPRLSLSEEAFHLYYIREMRPNGICLQGSHQLLFVKDTAELNPVPGGIDEPLPRVSAHEIGHALGLPHRQDFFNLMASGTTGTSLNEAEVKTTRETAQKWTWCLKPADALKLAEQSAADKPATARELYTTLAALPGGDVAKTARQRLETPGE